MPFTTVDCMMLPSMSLMMRTLSAFIFGGPSGVMTTSAALATSADSTSSYPSCFAMITGFTAFSSEASSRGFWRREGGREGGRRS